MSKPIRIDAKIIHRLENEFQSEDASSGVLGRGWILNTNSDGLSYIEVDDLRVRNALKTHIFQHDIVKATSGQLLVSDSVVVKEVGGTTLKVKTTESSVLKTGDRLTIRDRDSNGKIYSAAMEIVSKGVDADGITPYIIKSFTPVAVDAGAVFEEGMTAVRTNGARILIAASGDEGNTPYISFHDDTGTTTEEVVRIGNIDGSKGNVDGYGLYATNVELTGKITATRGKIGGWAIDGEKITGGNTTLDSDGSIRNNKFAINKDGSINSIEDQFHIDSDGNAFFKGDLAIGSVPAEIRRDYQTAVDSATSAAESAAEALELKNAAEAAESLAETAKEAAETARQEAITAKELAETAEANAGGSEEASEIARDLAVAAESAAKEYERQSMEAKLASEAAKDASEAAKEASELARIASEAARDLSLDGATASEAARDASEAARLASVEASGVAIGARNIANQAKIDAEAAQAAAEIAKTNAGTSEANSAESLRLAKLAEEAAEEYRRLSGLSEAAAEAARDRAITSAEAAANSEATFLAEAIRKGTKTNGILFSGERGLEVIDKTTGEVGLTLSEAGIFSKGDSFAIDVATGSASFKGDITGASGEIGGITLGASGIKGQNFEINTLGELTATDANIKGHIEAASGTFAGDISAATGTFGGSIPASTITNVTNPLYDTLGSASAAETAAINAAALDATTKANAAALLASGAQSTADTAVSNASTAQSAADIAKAEADQAISDAAAAQLQADNATSDSEKAQLAADNAKAEADKAVLDAAAAQLAADTAESNAQTAIANAATAQAAAKEAQTTADTAVIKDTSYDTVLIGTGGIKIGDATGVNPGLTINSGGLSSADGSFSIHATTGAAHFGGTVAIGAGNSIFKADTSGIYLGSPLFASAPFSVTPEGVLKATGAEINGTIGGNISEISVGGATNPVLLIDGTATGTSPVLKHSKFQLKADGSASFAGDISAASGTFTGEVKVGSGQGLITINDSGLSVGSRNFSIDSDGVVTATGLSISESQIGDLGSYATTSSLGTLESVVQSHATNLGTIETNLGTVETSLGTLGASVQGIEGDISSINTNYSNVVLDLANKIESNQGGNNISIDKDGIYIGNSIGSTGLKLTNQGIYSTTASFALDSSSGTMTIGNLGGNHMTWDSEAGNLNIDGTIGGSISEISVGSMQISDRLVIDEDGITANDGNNNTTFNIDSNTGSAYFKGHVEAESGTFAGSLSAAKGTFAGEMNAGSININNNFKVSSAGVLEATEAKIGGTITAESGSKIGGWDITSDNITSGNTTLSSGGGLSLGSKLTWNGSVLNVDGNIGGNIGMIEIGGASTGRVTISSDGIKSFDSNNIMTVNIDKTGSASFAGRIDATGGTIGDWNIVGSSLSSTPGADLSRHVELTSKGSAPESPVFLAGGNNLSSASFGVTRDGTVKASKGRIGNLVIGTKGDILASPSSTVIDESSFSGIGMASKTSGGRREISSFYNYQSLEFRDEYQSDTDPHVYFSRFSSDGLQVQDTLYSRGRITKSVGEFAIEADTVVLETEQIVSATSSVFKMRDGGGTEFDIRGQSTNHNWAISSEIVKSNIREIEESKIEKFLETVQSKTFMNELSNKRGVSLIIEDEIRKDLPFSDILFKREKPVSFTKEGLPGYLVKQIGTENLIEKEGRYELNVLTYDSEALIGVLTESSSYLYRKMKEMEKEIEELKTAIKGVIYNVNN